MKINNKLKAISIAACCFVASLWSETQGTDSQNNILESVTVNRTANVQTLTKNEIYDFAMESTPSQLIKLEDIQTSWASYMVAPIKSTIQTANELTNFTMNHPRLAIALSLAYVIPSVAAICACYTCFEPNTERSACDTWTRAQEAISINSAACVQWNRFQQYANYSLCIPLKF